MSVEEIRHATQEDDHLNALRTYGINGFPSTRVDTKDKIHAHWPF